MGVFIVGREIIKHTRHSIHEELELEESVLASKPEDAWQKMG